MLSIPLAVCAVQILLVQTAAVPVQDCGETFQSQLSQLMAIKQSCDSAALYDCCQVILLHSGMARRNYECTDM